MAIMIPEGIKQFTTDGERQVYHFLGAVAKPDSDYIVWYSPDIQGREPDFILYNDTIGLIILEVKDWSLEQILEADRKKIRLYMNGREETRKNPFQQAQGYFYACVEAMIKDGNLLSSDPVNHGKPKIPIHCGVVFPNINKLEFREKELGSVIEEGQVFFWDDLHPESPMCRDSSGQQFHSFLTAKFVPRFSFQLTGKEKVHLKQVIFPVVRFEQPRKCEATEYSQMEMRLSALDHHQESLARKYDGGHRILKGPSGCGKTLILVNKAFFLRRYNPQVKNILFVCFNITLVNYIKRMLVEKGVPLGKNGVGVFHFFELCDRLLEDKVEFEKQDGEYYQLVLEDALEASQKHDKYDAILVDEGQDFSEDMLRVIMNLLSPKTDSLTIALDESQNIYSTKRNWKDLGVHARGRTHSLNYVYRSTKELTSFTQSFNKEKELSKADGPKQQELFPGFFTFNGPQPVIKSFPDVNAQILFIAKEIRKLVSEHGYPLSEIAVLYGANRTPENGQQSLTALFDDIFSEQGILFNWVSEDYRAKKSYDITTETVTVSTIHSAKGFDYAALFVVGLDWFEESRWSNEEIARLAYVAITRARYRLYIPYIQRTQLIERLHNC
ncbi:MAG: AAA family ATPase [Bacteroidetes bacterium]|nr:AAA family ATPase [Bacteroidota bacterium]